MGAERIFEECAYRWGTTALYAIFSKCIKINKVCKSLGLF